MTEHSGSDSGSDSGSHGGSNGGAEPSGSDTGSGSHGGTPFAGAEPLAREALRLVSSVQDWARRNLPDESEQHPNDCQWCPLCQFASVLRGERPEVTARVAEAGSAVVGALRALLDAATEAGPLGGAERREPAPTRPRVQRIDLSGENTA